MGRRPRAPDEHDQLTPTPGQACDPPGSQLRAEFIEAMNRQIKWLVGFAAAWTTVLVTLARVIG